MNCSLQYTGGSWICTCADLANVFDANPAPDDKILTAIKAFHQRFYPDEPPDAPGYPWMLHADPNKLPELKQKAATHELTWHWRLLLPLLRHYTTETKAANSIVLSVSQIRQWQLVSCFSVKWPDGDVAAALRVADKVLLRAPVFGKSHRITRCEVYAALYEESVKKRIHEAVDNAGDDPCRLAHVLGRHDTYFRVANPKMNDTTPALNLDMHSIADIEPEHAPVRLDEEEQRHACRPYGGAAVPVFSESNAAFAKPEEVLFSSDNYCRAFEQVSDVFNDTGARTVLVIAPPGSGKEKLSELLHSCRRHRGQRVTVSLTGLDSKAAAFHLFNAGHHDAVKHRCDSGPDGLTVKKDFKPETDDGAYFRAFGGTLVLDEIDKTDAAVRGMLLRLIENDEVCIPESSLVVRIPRESRPLLVLVGSATRKEFMGLPPIDLWSRVTHIVEMQHPLALGEDADRRRIAADYLRLFWLKQVDQGFRDAGLLKRPEQEEPRSVYEPLRERFAGWWRCFASRAVGDFVAEEIAAVLCAQGQPLPSVRTLRGTATRSFNLLFQSLLYHKNGDAPLEHWRRVHKDDTDFEPAEALQKLIETRMNPSSTATFSPEDVKALDEIRVLVRSGATIQV